jgi:lysophospholipase L1-like esterase
MTTILCFGDSNTHGTKPIPEQDVIDRHGPDIRWPGVMAKELGAGYRVVEEGLPGRTTVHDDPIEGAHMNGLTALPMLVGSHSPLGIVVLMLGTNDLKNRFAVTASDIAASIERLVATLRVLAAAPGRAQPKVLIVAPPPIQEVDWLAEKFVGGAEKSRKLGPAIRWSAERLGVAFLDAGEHIEVSPVDGLHYDARTHATLGKVIAAAVRDLEPAVLQA